MPIEVLVKLLCSIVLCAALLGVRALVSPTNVHAACDVIPSADKSFRSALGSVDRPFAAPGDFLEVTVRPQICDAGSPGLFSSKPTDYVVTFVFEPPMGANAKRDTVVVLANDCSALEAARAACEERPDVRAAYCLPASDVAGTRALFVDDDRQIQRRRLGIRFPDTDALLDPNGDDRTLSGPVTIAVTSPLSTPMNQIIPCGLASSRCADAGQIGLVACIDELFDVDGTCRTDSTGVDPTFGSFTALPPANDYQAICDAPSPPCDGSVGELRMTTDAAGNVLIPVDWRGVLTSGADDASGLSLPQLVRGTTAIPAFANDGGPIRIPSNAFLSSFSAEGRHILPIFDPQSDAQATHELALFGSVDAPYTVLRLARRSPAFAACAGGASAGQPCITDGECPDGACGPTTCVGGADDGASCSRDDACPGGECGSALFEFRDRYEGDVGPVVVSRLATAMGVCRQDPEQVCSTATADGCGPDDSCVEYRLSSDTTLPPEGLQSSADVFTLTESEAILDRDLNGNGNKNDIVLELRDRETGGKVPIGTSCGPDCQNPALAVTETREGRFRRPVVESEHDLVAFLESEPGQGHTDLNGNGAVFDTILRVFSTSGGRATDLLPLGAAPVADAAPLIDGRSLAISNGLVFFRQPEAAMGPPATEQFDSPHIGALARSRDGRVIALVAALPSTSDEINVFVYDRTTGVFEPVSVAPDGSPGNGPSGVPGGAAISADGRFVAFYSDASNLVDDDDNDATDLFVHDRLTGVTERLSSPAEGVGRIFPSAPSLSADGRFVAFESGRRIDSPDFFCSGEISQGCTEGVVNVFVADRLKGSTEAVSVNASGARGGGLSGFPSISADGRFVAFESWVGNLVPNDTNGVPDVFVHDRTTDVTERVSVDSLGQQGNDRSEASPASISGDGRFVVFESAATNLVPGDTNGGEDVFVHDRSTGVTDRMSLDANGRQGNVVFVVCPSFINCSTIRLHSNPTISDDGRRVTFTFQFAGDAYGSLSVRDRLTGITATAIANSDVVAPAFSSDVASDVTGDGDDDDVVLRVLDTTGSNEVIGVCPSDLVSVVAGVAVFLRPEWSGMTPNLPGCSEGPLIDGRADLNGDGDTTDAVVHFWSKTTGVQNLKLAATAIALSAETIAAIGDTGTLQVHPVGLGSWTDTGLPADMIEVCGPLVVSRRPGDHALKIWDTTLQTIIDPGTSAEDFVCGTDLIAFRTREEGHPRESLNGPADKDTDDDVLQVYDMHAHRVLNSGFAVTPCPVQACDPSLPYKVGNDTVTFLTFECDQGGSTKVGCSAGGTDLDGDGRADHLVLQVFAPRSAAAIAGSDSRSRDATAGSLDATAALGGVVAGICTNTGDACSSDAGCRRQGGPASDEARCFTPPGGCIHDVATSCTPLSNLPSESCAAGQFCEPVLGERRKGICKQLVRPCQSTRDCDPGDVCNDVDQRLEHLIAPLSKALRRGELFLGSGRCIEDLATSCTQDGDCRHRQFCEGGTCHRRHGACAKDGRCPATSLCRRDLRELLVVAADDADGDEIPDQIDDCPRVADPLQKDGDRDGVGDACDSASCGNGVRELDESCDGTDDLACPTHCSSACTCPCTAPSSGSKVAIRLNTRRNAGTLAAKLTLSLPEGYTTQKVTIRLDDTDGFIAQTNLGSLAAAGNAGRIWRFDGSSTQPFRVRLRRVGGKDSHTFRLVAEARRWFTAAAANRTPAETTLTATVGGQCFSQTVSTIAR